MIRWHIFELVAVFAAGWYCCKHRSIFEDDKPWWKWTAILAAALAIGSFVPRYVVQDEDEHDQWKIVDNWTGNEVGVLWENPWPGPDPDKERYPGPF